MLNLDPIKNACVVGEPFPYLAVAGLLDTDALRAVSADFPSIKHTGVFPLSELGYAGAFAELIDAINGPELEVLLEEKFGLALRGKPLMVTVRGHCHRKDGRIHTDSKDKILTCLLYLNESGWNADGGRLRLLRNGDDLNDAVAEVSPVGGNFVAFKRTDRSWHGHAPFEGPRRYVMFNWLQSGAVLAKNLGRHKLSAAFKRMGFYDGY